MDILTQKGRETLLQVGDAVEIWHKHMPDFKYIHTPASMPADIDGLLIKAGGLKGIVEVKCRVSMTVDAFAKNFKSEWLVTFDKIVRCIKVSDALQVPFIGFLYFPHEKTLLYKTIYKPGKGLQVEMKVANTKTQATVNGGTIDRDNSYIDMRDAERLV